MPGRLLSFLCGLLIAPAWLGAQQTSPSTVDDLVRMGLAQNKDVLSIRERIGEAQGAVRQASRRWACRTLKFSTAAADSVVRRPANTSVRTSIRFKSCLLICTQPNLSPPHLVLRTCGDILALHSYDIFAVLAHIW